MKGKQSFQIEHNKLKNEECRVNAQHTLDASFWRVTGDQKI
jgi:hypothetical protein